MRAVTTRGPRPHDSEYDFVGEDSFRGLETSGDLLTSATYRGASYGVSRASYEQVVRDGFVPVLVLTPPSAIAFDAPSSETLPRSSVRIFLDASDAELDARIQRRGASRGGTAAPNAAAVYEEDAEIKKQRAEDRTHRGEFLYVVERGSVEDQASLAHALYRLSVEGRTGILPKRIIALMTACGMLLEDASTAAISGASYDLRLGDEYFYGGRIRRLSDEEPILVLDSYDYAIVTTREHANLPRDICARFDLAVSLFAQGVLLSNGPQVDPGFRGPLFCLLFNTASSPVLLKRAQHYATIEFHRMSEPTEAYQGRYQQRRLLDYLPANAARGAINELKKEMEALREQIQKQQSWIWGMLSLVLALVAIYVAVR